MNPASGAIDARKLGARLAKGRPLTDELKTVAQFGLQFPKASQTVEQMGSLPQTSPLDWIPAGALSMATSNPLMLAGAAARPAARAAILSGPVQRGLLTPAGSGRLPGLLDDPMMEWLYRSSPVIGASR
jgi:hypothetical protein